ncbi:MAG: hypothetical protein ABW032_06545 [Burkholderiaceae bacterium]
MRRAPGKTRKIEAAVRVAALGRAPRGWPACLLAAAMAIAPFATPAQAPQSGDEDEVFYQRAATCAAALEVDQLALVARSLAGATGLRPDMIQVTQLGFTYVGTAYLRGLRNPRADQMLNAARAEQKGWKAARHAQVASECRAEADALYKNATSLEQWMVTKRATSRVDKFRAGRGRAAAAAAGSAAGSSTER